MVFSSINFLFYFLPMFLLIYYSSKDKYKNVIILIFSLFFYAWGEPKFVLLMILSAVLNYVFGLIIGYNKYKLKAKIALIASIVVNLIMLGWFKYIDFLIININKILAYDFNLLEIALPIGISFYTFQSMSYAIDVYRGDVPVQKNIITYSAYITFFPQLIAGPIVAYNTIQEQLSNREHSINKFSSGVTRFIIGLGKKLIVANQVGIVANEIFATPTANLSIFSAWLGAVAYMFQIYYDFSGYSDMAIGLGRMFGFEFLENFNYPYISKSITEFWRRWHISLSSWFKNYVYIPLGGNRVKTSKRVINLLIVWALTGLWHGAAWNFVVWGLYFFAILILEKYLLSRFINNAPTWLLHCYTLILILIGWILFNSSSLEYAFNMIAIMFGIKESIVDKQHILIEIQNRVVIDWTFMRLLTEYKYELIIAAIGSTPLLSSILRFNILRQDYGDFNTNTSTTTKKIIVTSTISKIYVLSIFFISLMYLINTTYNPFIYFRF